MREYLNENPGASVSRSNNRQNQGAAYAVFAKLNSAQTPAGHLIHDQRVSF